MGWSFRKSLKCDPFRINFSKSGIGVSSGPSSSTNIPTPEFIGCLGACAA